MAIIAMFSVASTLTTVPAIFFELSSKHTDCGQLSYKRPRAIAFLADTEIITLNVRCVMYLCK